MPQDQSILASKSSALGGFEVYIFDYTKIDSKPKDKHETNYKMKLTGPTKDGYN